MRKTLALLALLCLDSCSFGVRSPSSPLLNESNVAAGRGCTDSYARPVIDTLIAATLLALFANATGPTNSISTWRQIVAAFAIPPVPAIYGYVRVHACTVAKDEDQEILARRAQLVNAWRLTNTAILASHSDDCAAAKHLDREVKSADADFHAAIFSRAADIARCLDAPDTVAAPIARPYCFDETTDGMATIVCMPSELACNAARTELPPGNVTTACREADR